MIRAYFIARHVNDDNAQLESINLHVALKFAINGDENVEGALRVIQQWSVFTAMPANFGDRPNGVAGEGRFDCGVDALV
ncbi:MAG: hypothetical protein ACRD3T_12835 [Terriglobia bacterium]